jgi:hypothetical protein
MKIVLPLTLAAGAYAGAVPAGKLNKLPSTGEQWTSMKSGVEFQPAADLSPLAQHHLRRLTDTDTSDTSNSDFQANSKIFVDGAETYYDEYAQAWHALGWYIDCDYVASDEDGGDNNNDENNTGNGCQRFLLWAAVSLKLHLMLVCLICILYV